MDYTLSTPNYAARSTGHPIDTAAVVRCVELLYHIADIVSLAMGNYRDKNSCYADNNPSCMNAHTDVFGWYETRTKLRRDHDVLPRRYKVESIVHRPVPSRTPHSIGLHACSLLVRRGRACVVTQSEVADDLAQVACDDGTTREYENVEQGAVVTLYGPTYQNNIPRAFIDFDEGNSV